MKKSVSSSAARSGDVEEEVSEGASLDWRPEGRGRGILAAGEESTLDQSDFLFGSSEGRSLITSGYISAWGDAAGDLAAGRWGRRG